MRLLGATFLAAALVGLLGPGSSRAATREAGASSPIGGGTRQLLLVRSASWVAASGTLQRYERDAGGAWVRLGAAIPVDLGRRGMAWGRGLHERLESGPVKREGDGKSPAGAFALGLAFGAAAGLPDGAHAFPYLHALPSSYCVEDERSPFYNQIIDAGAVSRTSWQKWSELRRADGLFDWAVVVKQNDPDVLKGAGSCVFLHIWRGPHVPTAGCTSMPPEQIVDVVRWLDPRALPLLVQLPDPVLAELREQWGLPASGASEN